MKKHNNSTINFGSDNYGSEPVSNGFQTAGHSKLFSWILLLFWAVSLFSASSASANGKSAAASSEMPNVIIIFLDDMGYGDPGCFNPESKIPTPNINQLAGEGMCFTDAHSSAAICVPSRYALMTGRYSARTWTAVNRRQREPDKEGWVSPHYGLPTIFRDRREGKETLNLPQFMKQNGYITAAFGKWHQGAIRTFNEDGTLKGFSPIDFGFDYFFGVDAASATRWVENRRKVECEWDKFKMLPTLVSKAEKWLHNHVETNKDKPFFLYYAPHAPHHPLAPAPEDVGKSGAGEYGDYVISVDKNVGQLLTTVKRLKLDENSLVFFTSDNGPALWKSLKEAPYFHRASGPWNAGKGSRLEGGHRMPFIARWPGYFPAGSTCGQRICFTDFLATMADLLNKDLPDDAGPDSFSFLPLLRGETPAKPIRTTQIHESYGLYRIGYTSGDWKLLLPDRGYYVHDQKVIPGHILPDKEFELYNLKEDPGETTNLANKNPERLKTIFAAFKADIEHGRSRPVKFQ